jgi:hypothetical protein
VKTDAQWAAWLADPLARRVTLLDVTALIGATETPIYLSLGADYTTAPTDTPANTTYQGIASAGTLFTEELALPLPGSRPGGGGLSSGRVTVSNPNGVRYAWFDYVWANRRVVGWLGDPSWPFADFRIIFDGTVADIAPDTDAFVLKLGDKLQRLNGPLSEVKVGGNSTNKDELVPNIFGEVHNVPPRLVDAAQLKYQVHNGQVEGTIEVRANGVPVDIFNSPSTGTFRLKLDNQGGQITASVKGDAPGGVYSNTVSKLVQRLITAYGKASDRLSTADLDLTNFSSFDTAHVQPVGLPAFDRMNVVEACQTLADSVGAELVASPDGKLRLLKVALPPTGPTRSIYPQEIEEGSLQLVDRTAAVASIKLGFCRNWAVQEGLETGIPEQHKTMYATEWLTATAVDETVRVNYRLSSDPPEQQDTCLLRRVDAAAEADRRLAMWKTPRKIFELTVLQSAMDVSLGQVVTIYNKDYGMVNGVNALIIARGVDTRTLRTHLRIIL